MMLIMSGHFLAYYPLCSGNEADIIMIVVYVLVT